MTFTNHKHHISWDNNRTWGLAQHLHSHVHFRIVLLLHLLKLLKYFLHCDSTQTSPLWTTSGSPGWIEWTLGWAFLALKLTCQFRTSVNLPISRHQCLFCKSSQLPLLLQRTLMWTSSNRHCDVKACQHSFTSSRKLLQWLGWFKPAGCGFVELFVLAGNMSGNYTRLIDYCRHRGMVVESPGKNF